MLNIAAKSYAYHDTLQGELSGAGYFRDVDNLDIYLEKSSFLAKINNEVIHEKNLDYRERVMKLNSATLFMWDSDEVLYPRETQFFD